MIRISNTSALLAVAITLSASGIKEAFAQTSYPMLMSAKPAAVQAGQTAEIEIESRYSMFDAYAVLISGSGVTGEISTPMAPGEDGNSPNLTKIKLRVTAAAGAAPGVRDFRVVGPTGPSTVGQLVVVRDPVVVESEDNDAPEGLTPIAWPATLCGTLEKSEDVDCFPFSVSEPTTLQFHCRAMRLEDRIHDLQQHVDPILTIRNAQTGATVAAADNTYAADPLLSAPLAPGEYWLEIRDVRYQGNKHWVYVVEMNNRPFITQVHPLGVAAGQTVELQPVGFNIADPIPMPFTSAAAAGEQLALLNIGPARSNPVEVVVSEIPVVLETDATNNSPAEAQEIAVPAGVSGRLEAESDIDCFALRAKKGERFNVDVAARRHWSALDSVVRILNADGAAQVENDDFARWGKRTTQDSAIEGWTAPADGRYAVEIRDVHARGGLPFVYFLKITRAEPDFELTIDTDKTWVSPGACAVIFVRARRMSGFVGAIDLHIDGLPRGVTAHCGRILPGAAADGCIVLEAAADASMNAANVSITGSFTNGNGETSVRAAIPFQETYMPGGGRNHMPVEMHTVGVGRPADLLDVVLSEYDLRFKPGESKRIDVTLSRSDGFDKNVTLDLLFQHLGSVYGNTLPAGVSLDKKNSTLLLSGGDSQGHLTLTADVSANAVESQQCCVMANVSINFVMKATYASRPLRISIDAP